MLCNIYYYVIKYFRHIQMFGEFEIFFFLQKYDSISYFIIYFQFLTLSIVMIELLTKES